MKKIFFLLTILSYMIFGAEKIILVVDENNPPYSFVENKVLKGLYIDFIKKIDENIVNFSIEFEPVPWVRAIKLIETGEAYGIISPWYRPLERPFVYYSSPFFKEERVVVSILKDSSFLNWPKDFKNKKIGINRGYLAMNKSEKDMLTIEEANKTSENLLKLFSNRIDFYVNDKYAILWELTQMKKKNLLSTTEIKNIKFIKTLGEERGYIGYSKNYKNKSVQFENDINREIEKLEDEGYFNTILFRYELE